jgi:hypothetical protein
MRRWVTQLARFSYLLFLLCFMVAPTGRAQDAPAKVLKPGTAGTPYPDAGEIKAEGGLAPLTWHLSGGQLPPGLSVSPDGKIAGTPATAASQPFTFEMTVSDSSQTPQIATQRFSIVIGAAPLRIAGSATTPGSAPLRIIAPLKSPSAEGDRPPMLEPQHLVAERISYNPPRQPRFVVPLQATPTTPSSPKPDVPQKPAGSGGTQTASLGPLDPATFIQVYEDPKTGDRQLIYDPPKTITEKKKTIQLVADFESSIIIFPDGSKMGEDIAFNKLYITAKLASGNSSKDVIVNGYSEVGKDQATMAAQSGTAFQSAANIQAMVLNMAYTASDIIDNLYQPTTTVIPSGPIDFTTWGTFHKEIDFRGRGTDAKTVTDAIANAGDLKNDKIIALKARLRLYEPEIQAISDFLVQKENLGIVEKIGGRVFGIDRDSISAIAQQYKDDIQIAFDPKSTDPAQLNALQDLFQRTKLVYEDFGDIRQTIIAQMDKKEGEKNTYQDWQIKYEKTLQDYALTHRKDAASELKRLLATGSISLTENQAKDGDRLTITVESVPSGSTSGGIPVVFEVAIKKFGAKIQVSPSLLFIRRLGVTDVEATPPAGSTTAPLNRVNFAPSPGTTFGVAYFKRGSSSWDKFARGLGPGLGMNVTFMNYNDPSFNLATSQFTTTNGTNVQVGAGVIASLFDDKLQFTYGWNLNVEKRRSYFGVGFGFIEIGKELAKYISK